MKVKRMSVPLMITGAAFSGSALQSEATNRQLAPNDSGTAATLGMKGSSDRQNAFFQSLGTNGRACVTCHLPESGWSIVPSELQVRFASTGGLDPIFRTNDGSNNPLADISTIEKRRTAFSLLLNKGLIRVGLPVPSGAEFELAGVDDPYGYASARELSLFRRPLPSANLRFLSAVMWDGRETITKITGPNDLRQNLEHQVIDATVGHAQASAPPSPEQVKQIVEFESGLHFAQVVDNSADDLQALGANGGPEYLSKQKFFIGINDPLGGNPSGATFNREAMQLFNSWNDNKGSGDYQADGRGRNSARQSVARGEEIFNTRSIAITGVGGLNDALGMSVIQGTCTTCHDTPNVGNHSVSVPLNIGLTDQKRRTPDLPLYTLRNKATGEKVKTTDPGRALITGKWEDVGKFKGPVLRGLAARAPYFHNGSAMSLDEVVDFYNTRFSIGLTGRESDDLVAFLKTL